MKIKILAFIGVVCVACGVMLFDLVLVKPIVVQHQGNEIDISEVELVPGFTVDLLEGNSISIGDISEGVILLNFWASWCVSCIKEFPEMLELVKFLDGKVALFAISIDDELSDMTRFLEKLDNYNIKNTYWAWDNNKNISLNLFNTMRVPETIIINKKRLMVKKIVGAVDWNSVEMRQLISNVLNNSPI